MPTDGGSHPADGGSCSADGGGHQGESYPAEEEASRRFRIIPAVYLVLRRVFDDRRQVLLQFRDGTPYMDKHWACGAAGHIEAAESLWAAAAREASEELGVGVDPADLIPLTVMQRRSGDAPIDQRVDIFLACDHWSGEPSIQEEDKASRIDWFDLDELPSPLVPHERLVLEGLRDGDLPHLLATGFDE